MFSVYGLNGPVFHGVPEHLPRVPKVERRPPASGARPLGADDARDNPQEEFSLPAFPHSGAGAALSAYQSIQHVDEERGPVYQALQIMQRDVITVDAEDRVEQAWSSLAAHGIHQAPVLDAAGALIGIVSERDLLTALNLERGKIRDILARQVRDVMSSPVVSADPSTDIRQIAWVMLEDRKSVV